MPVVLCTCQGLDSVTEQALQNLLSEATRLPEH